MPIGPNRVEFPKLEHRFIGLNSPAASPKSTWHSSGILLIVFASLLWSTSGFFARAPQLDIWPQEERGAVLSFWRAIFALSLMLPCIRRPSWSWGMLPMVACFAVMNWTYLTALVSGPPANAIWLQNLAPVWVMLVGVFFLGERTVPRDWMMLVLCATGVLFILFFQIRQGGSGGQLAMWLGLLSGVFYAGVVLSLRMLRNQDPAWLVAANHLTTAVVMAPFALASSHYPQGSTWILFAAFGMFQMGLPYLLFARGLQTTPSHIASVLTLLEPILLPLWIHLAWSHTAGYEPPPWWTLIGGAFILAGLLVRFTPLPSRSPKPST